MKDPRLHHLTDYKSFYLKRKIFPSLQAPEVSQNWLDQDLKHIAFYQITHFNKYLWSHLEEC